MNVLETGEKIMTVSEVRDFGGVFILGDILRGDFGIYIAGLDLDLTALNRNCWAEVGVVKLQRPCTFNIVNGEVNKRLT